MAITDKKALDCAKTLKAYCWLSYSAYYTIKKLEEKVQAYAEFVPWSLRGVSDK